MPRSQAERTDVKRSSKGSDKRLSTRTKKKLINYQNMPNTYTRKHMIMPSNSTKNPIKDAGVRVKVLKKWHTKLPGRR